MIKKEKTYTVKEAMAHIKKSLNNQRQVVNPHLKKYLYKIVNKELAKECRVEAMKILMKAKRQEVAEFLYAYHYDEGDFGLYCITLDSIKDRLVREKQVGKNFGSKFGNKF